MPFVLKSLPLRINYKTFIKRSSHRGCGVATVSGCAAWYSTQRLRRAENVQGIFSPALVPTYSRNTRNHAAQCPHPPVFPLPAGPPLRYMAAASSLALPFFILRPVLLEPVPQPPSCSSGSSAWSLATCLLPAELRLWVPLDG